MTDTIKLDGYKPPKIEATKKKVKPKMRRLTGTEKLVVSRQRQDFKELIEKWKYDQISINRNLEKGYDLEVKQKKVNARRRLAEIKAEVKQFTKNIKVLDRQIRVGVQVKAK